MLGYSASASAKFTEGDIGGIICLGNI